jgi:hypothetical protein
VEIKIQKTDKIIIIFYIFLAISFTIGISYITSTFDTTEHLIEFPQPVTELQITKIVDVNQEEAFLIMTDVKNYPKILPRNIISVNIINQIDNSVLAEYEVIEHGIHTKLLANHTMYPYDKHIIEVMDGDAKGTKLIQDFTVINTPVGDIGGISNLFLQGLSQTEIAKLSECNSPFDECTRIDSQVELNLEGLLSPFSYLPKRNLDHASNTVITSFTNYMEIKTKNEKIIDDLYREILLRPADTGALEDWGSLLDTGIMTVDEIRTEILNSDEKKSLLTPLEMKTVEELDDETKKIIDDLYREILLRPADTGAFEYWGSLLESEKITKLELRKSILKSEEALSLKKPEARITESIYSIFHEVYELNGPYREEIKIGVGDVGEPYDAFDPRIDQDEFKKMVIENEYRLKIEDITLDELRLELEQLKENGIDFFVDDLESVNEQFLDWKKRFVDKTHDFCYTCKWKNLAGSGS